MPQQIQSLVRAHAESTMSPESATRRITTSRGLRWALGCTTLVVGVAVPVIYHYQAGVLDQAMIHQEGHLQDAIVRV